MRVWRCRFDDEQWDVNYDAWPDRWTRVYDDEHPHYARIEIGPTEAAAVPGRALVIRPDGVSATATSPPIHVMPKFSYKLRFRARLGGTRHGVARVRMDFHSPDGVRQVERSAPLVADGAWREVDFGDFQPNDPAVDRVYVHIDFQRGERGDLDAELAVADLRLYRLPSIKISTGSRYNVYTRAEDVLVTCGLTGILEQNPEVRFQLLDATNKSIGDGGTLSLDGTVINESRALASDIVDGYGSSKTSYEGSIDWKPPIRDYGFYRVKVGMFHEGTDVPVGASRSITIAVVREQLENTDTSEFGWSLPTADRPLPFPVLQELLPRVGVRMVKTPVWFAPGDERRGDELVRFAEQLAARGIETVGVLEDPTPRVAEPLSRRPPPPIEGLLSADPSYWTPLLDHVITRLSLRIRWWQLGGDGDISFVGHDKLVERLGAIRNQMFRFGQDIRMGIGWRWDHATAWGEPLTWDFEQMASVGEAEAAKLQASFDAAPPSTAQRWVTVAPPDAPLELPEGVTLETPEDPRVRAALVARHQRRVRDFVAQILVAKINGADGVFVSDPFSGSPDSLAGDTGVMNHDGTPGELLLPWRTCARLLGGADYLGTLRLPASSENWLFKRPDGRIVMVLWNLSADSEDANAAPLEEELYLGENVEVVDVWGAAKRPELRDGRHVIPVGRMPRFVVGLDEGIARWRMSLAFQETDVPSVFGSRLSNALMLKNEFGQGIGGTVRVFVPARGVANPPLSQEDSSEWQIDLDDPRFTLAAGQSLRLPIGITLQGAGFGPQLVRCDFDVSADREYRFSVWRELVVGLEHVTLAVQTYLRPDGALVVEQRMRNTSGVPVDFRCSLHANGRRRKRALVFQLGQEEDVKRYTYLNPAELIGADLRLLIEEIDGQRKLIHHFRADPQAATEAAESGVESAL